MLDASSTPVAERFEPYVGNSGAIVWDGQIAAVTIAPGDYTFELQALRQGAVLGTSVPWPFTVYRSPLKPTTVGVGTNGAPILVNSDDDDMNNVADLTQSPAATGEDDLVSIDFGMQPSTLSGTLVLSSSVTPAPFRVWTAPDKSSEIVLPHTYNLPADVVPSVVFVEGTTAAPASLTAQLTPTGAAALPPKALKLNLVELSTMRDANNNFVIDAGDASTLFVRLGLWDFAFRITADANGAVGTLFNQQDDVSIASSGDPQNFIAHDTRRFYLQIKDPARNTDPATAEEIPLSAVEWFTVKADGSDDDHPAASANVVLRETGPDTGTFVSPAVMLVAGQIDRDQPTNSGMAAHPGLPGYNAANHRTRQVVGPDGKSVMRYLTTAGATKLTLSTPLFQRAPEDRRVVTVRFFNFSDSTAGVAAVPDATVTKEMRQLTERFAVMGFRANALYNPLTDKIDLPAGSPVNLDMVGGFTGGFATLAPSSDESALITLVRGVDPATAANADTIYVVVIRHFADASANGQSFPDGWIAAGAAYKNFTFMAGLAAMDNDFTSAHEITAHMLCNQTLTLAESSGGAPGWASGGHYGGPPGRPDLKFNLCADGPGTSVPVVVTDALRIWDDTTHILQQITRARTATRYLKMP